MTRRGMIGFLAASTALMLAGCQKMGEALIASAYPVYHQRLIVTVDTPQGVRMGSSVIAVQPSARTSDVTGEAVAVDLPGGQTLFVLLRSESEADWTSSLHNLIPRDGDQTFDEVADYYKWVARQRGIYEIPRTKRYFNEDKSYYPYFVRFRDLRDPKSVEAVDPNDLAKSFGPGVKIKSFVVQFTDATVTKGIVKRLRWLEAMRGMVDNTGNPNRLHDDPVKNLTKRDFIQGEIR